MIIAQQKRNENIIEYMLYMWQVEDIIRASNLDIKKIDQTIIPSYKAEPDKIIAIRDWWESLAEMMKIEKKETSGHIQVITNLMNEVNKLHTMLLRSTRMAVYINAYQRSLPHIRQFELKSAAPFSNDIECCLTAIYSTFLLKLSNKKINPETQQALESMTSFLSQLARNFKLYEEGDLELDK